MFLIKYAVFLMMLSLNVLALSHMKKTQEWKIYI